MAGSSDIEWTNATWNPVAGCSLASPGCTNCYAMRMAARLEAMGIPLYQGLTKPGKGGAVWTGEIRQAEPDQRFQPLRWRKPRNIFVDSMSDLFHADVPDAWIDEVFSIMEQCPQHTFQVLTKRPGRVRAYLSAPPVRFRSAKRITNASFCKSPMSRTFCRLA
jgi:protein gp37